MYPMVDDKLRIVYQADFEPGLIVRGDEDLVDLNSIYYLEVDTVGLFDNTSTSINEIYQNNNIDDNRIFDLLGRMKTVLLTFLKEYIINRKKYLKQNRLKYLCIEKLRVFSAFYLNLIMNLF